MEKKSINWIQAFFWLFETVNFGFFVSNLMIFVRKENKKRNRNKRKEIKLNSFIFETIKRFLTSNFAFKWRRTNQRKFSKSMFVFNFLRFSLLIIKRSEANAKTKLKYFFFSSIAMVLRQSTDVLNFRKKKRETHFTCLRQNKLMSKSKAKKKNNRTIDDVSTTATALNWAYRRCSVFSLDARQATINVFIHFISFLVHFSVVVYVAVRSFRAFSSDNFMRKNWDVRWMRKMPSLDRVKCATSL